MANEEEINSFLQRFHELYKLNKISWVRVPEHDNDLAELEMTRSERDAIILSLNYLDYSKGPEEDDKSFRRAQYWFFGKCVNSKEIYIKLTILDYVESETCQRIEKAKIVSFKKSKRQISYPFS